MQTSKNLRTLTVAARRPLFLGFLVLLVLLLPECLIVNLLRGLASFPLLLAALDADDITSLALLDLFLGVFPHLFVALDLVSSASRLIYAINDMLRVCAVHSLIKRQRVNQLSLLSPNLLQGFVSLLVKLLLQ